MLDYQMVCKSYYVPRTSHCIKIVGFPSHEIRQVADAMLICGGMDATGELGDCTLGHPLGARHCTFIQTFFPKGHGSKHGKNHWQKPRRRNMFHPFFPYFFDGSKHGKNHWQKPQIQGDEHLNIHQLLVHQGTRGFFDRFDP